MTTRQSHLAFASSAFLIALAGCGAIALGPDGGAGGHGGAASADAGPAGNVGSAGDVGTAGDTGAAGSAGATGAAGSTGSAGATGTGGSTGAGGQGGGAAGAGGTAGHGGAGGSSGAGGGAAGHAGTCPPVCAIFCQYGNVTDANGCPTCACKPAPAECTQAECPPPPPYAQPMCASGKIIPASCGRNTDGKCVWTPPSCLNVCPAIACLQACPYGNKTDANGCTTCSCNLCPTGTHQVSCPAIACALSCANGYVHGADGCATCACRVAATCAPANVLCGKCDFGSRTGPNGCRSCACEDPPAGCAADNSFAAANAPATPRSI